MYRLTTQGSRLVSITPAELRRALDTAAQIADRDQGDGDLEGALQAIEVLRQAIDKDDVISACEIRWSEGEFFFLHGHHSEALRRLRLALCEARSAQHLELTIAINRLLSRVEDAIERTSYIPAQTLR